jgi:hypothetical protein
MLMATNKEPEPHEQALKAAQEAQAQAAAIRKELEERDRKSQEWEEQEKTARAYRLLRHEIASEPETPHALILAEMDAAPEQWARTIRAMADRHPDLTAREIAAKLQEARLAYLTKLVQTPAIAKLLKLAQPTPPAAPTGSTSPKTITAKLAGDRVPAEPPPISRHALQEQRIKAGIAKLAEIQAQRAGSKG